METLLQVLVVDDNEDDADTFRARLVAAGYDVQVKYSSEGALEYVEESGDGCDLLVLDVNMPGLDGVTLARRLRQRGYHIPTIFVSGEISNGIKRAIQGMGASVDYLQKPFSGQDLERMAMGLISNNQLYVQIGEIKHSVLSLTKTVDARLLTPNQVLDVVEAHCEEKCTELERGRRSQIDAVVEERTAPGALIERARGSALIRAIAALLALIITGAFSLVLYNFHLATKATADVIEVKQGIDTISGSMIRQTATMVRIEKKLQKLEPPR